jgi:hypothetical protein
MISDNDIKKLKTVFATKNDLKLFATKDDLKRFATKDDLEELELRVAKSFEETQKHILALTEVVTNLDKKFVTRDEFVTFEDHILGEIKKLFDENIVRSEHRREIDDHERRITKLERVAFSN